MTQEMTMWDIASKAAENLAALVKQASEKSDVNVESVEENFVIDFREKFRLAMQPIKVGDTVTRLLAGTIPMELKVTNITDDRIICGGWEFDKKTGAEIDDDLGWGPPPKMTGSYIKMPGVHYTVEQ